jgi:hypothetical protein
MKSESEIECKSEREMMSHMEDLICALECFAIKHQRDGTLLESVVMDIKSQEVDTVLVFSIEDHKIHVMQYTREFEDVYPWTCLDDVKDKRALCLELYNNIDQTTPHGCTPQITLGVNGMNHTLV